MTAGVLNARDVLLPYVCTLEQTADETSVGGKAWNLARMLSLGVPVPPRVNLGLAPEAAEADHRRTRRR